MIAALQICAGIEPLKLPAALGDDGIVGLEEAIQFLRVVSGLAGR